MSLKIAVIAKRLVLDFVLGRFRTFTALADAIGVAQVFRKILNKRPSDTAGATDQIGPFAVGKNLTEQPSITDVPAKTLTTSRDDATSVAESFSPVYGKVFTESLRATDDLDGTTTPLDDQEIQFGKFIVQRSFAAENFERTVSYNREFSDSGSVAENAAKSLSKSFSDVVNAAESIFVTRSRAAADSSGIAEDSVFTFGKSLSDSGFSAEDTSLTIGKGLSDSPSVAESIAFGIGFSLEDNSAAAESLVIAYSTIKSDTAGIAESHVAGFGKVLSDQPAIAESATLSPSKVLSDGGISTDLPVKSIGQTFTDASSANDDGSLRSQGYCDFDYFAEDYVGQSRTFT